MKRKHFLAGFAVLLITVMFALAGCDDPTNPVTGETLLTGNLRVVNEHSGEIARLYVRENNGGQAVWDELSYAEGNVIAGGTEKILSGIPAGTWQIELRGIWIDDVKIVAGLTTTVTYQSGGTLIKGEPL